MPESQADEYHRLHGAQAEIVAHPDSVAGIAAKRQWIYDRWGDVFMMDDDADAICRMYLPSVRGKLKLSPSEARELIDATAATARNLGAYLFGFMNHCDTRHFFPYHPLRLKGFCNAQGLGLLAGSKIFFHRESIAVADFFASAINAYHHRYMFADWRFAVRVKDTWKATGGLAAQRSAETERKDFLLLKRMFGDAIIPKKSRPNIDKRDGKAQNKRKPNQWERELRLPF